MKFLFHSWLTKSCTLFSSISSHTTLPSQTHWLSVSHICPICSCLKAFVQAGPTAWNPLQIFFANMVLLFRFWQKCHLFSKTFSGYPIEKSQFYLIELHPILIIYMLFIINWFFFCLCSIFCLLVLVCKLNKQEDLASVFLFGIPSEPWTVSDTK